MNKRRLASIASWLERGAPEYKGVDKFDMDSLAYIDKDCGTACCIAGAACFFFDGANIPAPTIDRFGGADWVGYRFGGNAERLLGLKEVVANKLFYGFPQNLRVTPRKAAKVIRHLIETGEVDWKV